MSVTLTEIQTELLKSIAKNCGFTSYYLEQYSCSAQGDNYLGQIIGITIIDKAKKLELILKICPQNENLRNTIQLREVFLKEISMYERILANFAMFQKDIGVVNPFRSYPKHYGKCELEFNECLVLENLVENGYKHWNRKIPMNSDHISLVMSEYARYHSVSYALKMKKPGLFDDLVDLLKREALEKNTKGFEGLLESSTSTIQKAIQGNPILENAFNNFLTQIPHFFINDLKEDEKKMIISHGDSWCNNIMFKYEVSIILFGARSTNTMRGTPVTFKSFFKGTKKTFHQNVC